MDARFLFDVDPSKNAYASILGSEYPGNSVVDFNGGFYYAKATFEF